MKSSSQDEAEGIAKNIFGSLKEAMGKAIGNHRRAAYSRADKIESQVQRKISAIKQMLWC